MGSLLGTCHNVVGFSLESRKDVKKQKLNRAMPFCKQSAGVHGPPHGRGRGGEESDPGPGTGTGGGVVLVPPTGDDPGEGQKRQCRGGDKLESPGKTRFGWYRDSGNSLTP